MQALDLAGPPTSAVSAQLCGCSVKGSSDDNTETVATVSVLTKAAVGPRSLKYKRTVPHVGFRTNRCKRPGGRELPRLGSVDQAHWWTGGERPTHLQHRPSKAWPVSPPAAAPGPVDCSDGLSFEAWAPKGNSSLLSHTENPVSMAMDLVSFARRRDSMWRKTREASRSLCWPSAILGAEQWTYSQAPVKTS